MFKWKMIDPEIENMSPEECECYYKGKYMGFVIGALVGIFAAIGAVLIGIAIAILI